MAFSYSGTVDAVFIDAAGAEHSARFTTVLDETMAHLFDLSTPRRLPAAQGAVTVCLTLDDGRSLGGDVQYIGDFGLTFTRPQVDR